MGPQLSQFIFIFVYLYFTQNAKQTSHTTVCGHCGVFLIINTMKRISEKLRLIILPRFGLITFRFHCVRSRKPQCSWFQNFWNPYLWILMYQNTLKHLGNSAWLVCIFRLSGLHVPHYNALANYHDSKRLGFDISSAHVNAHGTECPARLQGARTTSSIADKAIMIQRDWDFLETGSYFWNRFNMISKSSLLEFAK